MINAISHSRIYVTDQDEALDFYVGKLGMEVSADVQLEEMRWLTVRAAGEEAHNILLEVPGNAFMDSDTAEEVRSLTSKGSAGMVVLSTPDCQATFEDLKDKDVEFIQEPVERFYGTDCAVRDPFGNHIRITEPAPDPIELPDEVSAA